MQIVIPLLLALALTAHASPVSDEGQFRYGIVIDAGRSGSRARIYKWTALTEDNQVPDITEISNVRVKPPLADFLHTLDQIPDYIQQMLDHAKENVPEAQRENTDIYLLGTAGMRFLPAENASVIMDAVNDVFSDRQRNPFRYIRQNARVLAGEEEGAFAWLAANYLAGYFSGDISEPVGLMELGSGSTQISFLPAQPPLSGIFPVRVGGVVYQLYTHSYLNYGQDRAYIQTALNIIRKDSITSNIVPHPCVLAGDSVNYTINGIPYSLQGSGNATACEALMDEYVYQVAPDLCYPKPCAIGPFYQPAIHADRTFYAFSGFYYPIPVLGLGDAEGTVTPDALRQAALIFCGLDFAAAVNMSSDPPEYASSRCLTGLYTYALFTRAYGFAPDTTHIKFVNKINGESVQWAHGAMLYHTTNYMTSYNAASHKYQTPFIPFIVFAVVLRQVLGFC